MADRSVTIMAKKQAKSSAPNSKSLWIDTSRRVKNWASKEEVLTAFRTVFEELDKKKLEIADREQVDPVCLSVPVTG